MDKTIVSFEKDPDHNQGHILQVVAAPIEPGKVIETRNYLESKNFFFHSIESDVITARARGNYNDLLKTLKELEKDGWTWK